MISKTTLYAEVLAYTIVSIGIVIYGTNLLLPSGPVRAILFAIGSLLIFIFFGFRWFSSMNSSTSTTPTWPPTINTCPDYLTFIPSITSTLSSSGGGCVDYLGMSRNGVFKLSDSTAPPRSYVQSEHKVFPYTNADVNKANKRVICELCLNSGLTWEGVYDGDTCIGSDAADAAAAAGNCPSQ